MPSPSDSASPAEQRERIRDLLTAYGRHWDQGQVAAVAALFTADGEWRSKHSVAVGRGPIEALLGEMARGRGATDRPSRRHFTTNVAVVLDGATATAESDFLVVQHAAGSFTVVSMGSYRDRLVLQAEGWRLQRREIVHPD